MQEIFIKYAPPGDNYLDYKKFCSTFFGKDQEGTGAKKQAIQKDIRY